MTERRIEEHLPMQVRDEHGTSYTLVQQALLGRPGGFGSVFRAGDVAVKIFHNSEDALAVDARGLRHLPLADLQVARLVATIVGEWPGYVIELVPGMETWRALVEDRGSQEWWDRFGGYGRRLELCLDLTNTMAKLSERGLVFADLNPNNVMFSADLTKPAEAWLIDIDNLAFGSGRALAFRGYSAPELFAGRADRTTMTTDAWSLAVLVFTTLVAAHPFSAGRYVDEGAPDDDAEGGEAARGEVPWIDDSEERWNAARPGTGLDRQTFLTRPLRDYFQQMFGRGRLEPLARPSVGQLRRELIRALALVVTCEQCSSSVLARSMCPSCLKEMNTHRIRIRRSPLSDAEYRALADDAYAWTPPLVPDNQRDLIALGVDDTKELNGSAVAYGLSDVPLLSLRRHDSKLRIKRRSDNPMQIDVWSRERGWRSFGGETVLDVGSEWAIRIGPADGPCTFLQPEREV